MKKIISLILVIMIAASFCNISYAAAGINDTAAKVKIEAEATSGRPGETLTVTLYLTENPGFMFMRFTPNYDQTVLTLTGVSKEGAEVTFDGLTVEKNIVIDNVCNITGTGKLLTLTFAIAPDAPAGATDITFTARDCYTEDEEDVAFDSFGVSAPVVLLTVTLGSGEGVLDGTVELTITIENNPGFCYMELKPSVPDFMTIKKISAKNGNVKCSAGNLLLIESKENGDFTENGLVATVIFSVAEHATRGTYEIGARIKSLYNWGEDEVASAPVVPGTVTITCDHHRTELRNAQDPTCTEPGFSGDLYCSLCGDLLRAGEDVRPNGHSYGEPVFEWAEDCSAATARFVCSGCGDVQTVEATVTVETRDATCTEAGEKKYTASAPFGATTYTDEKSFSIEAKGHKYGEPVFEWADDCSAATARFTCSECEDVQTVTATVTVETNDATCTEAGENKYTATALFEGETYIDEKIVTIEPKGHDYSAVFNWADDYTAATLTLTCSHCGDVQTVEATVAVETRDATCTEAGEIKYTATALFEGVTYTDEKTTAIEPKDHKYGEPAFEWADDHSAATAKFVCSECGDIQTVRATVAEYKAEPSCTEKGLLRYTATAEFEGTTYTDTVSFELEAKGHSYGAVFEWSEDCKSATVTVTCSSCGDTHTAEAAVAEEVKTVREDGKAANVSVFSATAEFEGETYTEKKEVVNFLYGDVNGDGEVNGRDLIRLRKYLNGEDVVVYPGANVNGSADGAIDGKDLIRLRKYLVNPDLSLLGPN